VKIDEAMAQWFQVISGKLDVGEILAEDCVFYSPVVFTPQKGREITRAYLQAATQVFGGDSSDEASESSGSSDEGFHYRNQVMSGNTAVLEFETTMGGKYVNGVDMITFNDDGMITEFKVMIRPLQAVNLIHQMMGAQLEESA